MALELRADQQSASHIVDPYTRGRRSLLFLTSRNPPPTLEALAEGFGHPLSEQKHAGPDCHVLLMRSARCPWIFLSQSWADSYLGKPST